MKRARVLLASGGVCLLAVAAAAVAHLWGPSAPPATAPIVSPAATAEITRGPLRDTKTLTGILSYGELSTLRASPGDASTIVTSIAARGSIVERGDPLFALDGRPTILFYGSVPQHRTLRFDPGAASPVWVELEQTQREVLAAELALDLERERLDDAEARITDISARREDAALPEPATAEFVQLAGAIELATDKLARVRKLSAAEVAASVEIAAAEAGVAAARSAFDAAVRVLRKDLAAARLDAAAARVAIASAQAKLDELRLALAGLTARASDDADVRQIADNLAALGYKGALPEQVRAWQRDAGFPVTGVVGPSELVVATGPVHIATHRTSVGEPLSGSSPDSGAILDYSSVEKIATVPLNVNDQGLAALGREVTLTLPDDRRVSGTISEIGSVVTDGAIEVTVTIADQDALNDLAVAAVDVEFVSGSREDVLSVPIAALVARAEGGYAVSLVSSSGSTLVSVETGLFAAGRVEIAGEGLVEGMRVGVPG